jgi:hypothetical protein
MGQVVDSTVRVRPTGGAGPGTRVAGLNWSPRRIESLRPSERRNAFARRMARHCAKVNGFCPDAILARDSLSAWKLSDLPCVTLAAVSTEFRCRRNPSV